MQTTTPTLPPAVAEAGEAEFMYAYQDGTPAAARTLLGIEPARIGGGVVLTMSNDTTGYWNKALGFTEPVTGDLVDRVLDRYRSAGAPMAVLQIRPEALPADWATIAADRGIEGGGSIVKLACPIGDARVGSTKLRVGPVTEDDAQEWAGVILSTFGMPLEGLADMFAASVGNPRFRPFAAWEGDRIVAGANLYLHGDIGSLNTGATLAGHRNLGAQSALVAARIEAARAAGCRWLVSECGNPAPGEHNPSLANMLRAGLVQQYIRRNWIWRNPA